jgi:hypothetical protein
MLIQGGELAIPPESYVWSAVARGFSRWRFSSWENVTNSVIDAFGGGSDFGFSKADVQLIKSRAEALPSERRSLAAVIDLIYRSYCELNGFSVDRWGDKTPLNILGIRMIEDIFPSAQFVHIVRDPRAVALSIIKAAELSSRIREQSYAQAAERWNKSVRNARALALRVGPKRYFEVRYEDLVRSPQRELQRVCAFLRLSYVPAMLAFHEGASKLGDLTVHRHLERVGQPLDAARSDAWKDSIAPDDRLTVERITLRYRGMFGYG